MIILFISWIRRKYYKSLCKLNIHNYVLLPTVYSTKELVTYEICCGRCGRRTKDVSALLLVRILNKLREAL